MFKKVLLCLLCVVMLFNTVFAANAAIVEQPEIQPMYQYANDAKAYISISNGVASYSGSLTGISGTTTKFTVSITLQKKNLLWWNDVETWTKTIVSYQGDFGRTLSVSSGTYRTKAVFTVYSGSNTESITCYSGTKSC